VTREKGWASPVEQARSEGKSRVRGVLHGALRGSKGNCLGAFQVKTWRVENHDQRESCYGRGGYRYGGGAELP